MADDQTPNAVELATELTIAWLGNQNTRSSADDVPAFLGRMHETVQALLGGKTGSNEAAPAPAEHKPAVTVRRSLASPDHIISMIDGKPYKTLRRHLNSNGLTPDEYRARYGLKSDYPMVAHGYSTARREMAHKLGLGRKPGQKAGTTKAAEPAAEKPIQTPRRPRKTTVEAEAN